MYTLITITPAGAETRSTPVAQGPAVMLAVARSLATAAPWLTDLETRRLGLVVARSAVGVTSVHMATGYRFRIEPVAVPQSVAI